MENDLERRVAALETEMNEMATIIAPAVLKTLGSVAVLQAAVRAAANLIPPGALADQLLRQFLEDMGRDLQGSFGDQMTLDQFESDRKDVENRLTRHPDELLK